MRDERRRRLEEATETQQADQACIPALVDGDPADVLADQSGRLDLLVIGSRGYGAARATLWITAPRAVTASQASLIVRAPVPARPRRFEPVRARQHAVPV